MGFRLNRENSIEGLKNIKWKEVRDYALIVLAVILIRSFIMTPALVNGGSMDDTLKDGQLVILNKIVYRFKDINRFDIVVVKNYEGRDKIIKRVIGLPNETIEYKDNLLYINDELVKTDFDFKDTEDFSVTTSDGEYFVMGDNRPVSKDSRMLGNFTKKEIVGKVTIRLYPFNKIGKIDK